jgi:hypothetical protein
VFGEWFGFRSVAVFDDEEECGRGEYNEERVFDAVEEI